MYAYKREKDKKDIKGKKIKKWLIKKIKKVLTDGRFDDKITFAVAETGSYLDGEQNQWFEQKFNCCSKK